MHNTVLLFAKYPDPGNVKTRLAATIGDEPATRLYRCLVEDILEGISGVSAEIVVCIDPPERCEAFQEWLGSTYHYTTQYQGNLGERLDAAFSAAFSNGSRKVLAIGADCPDVSAETLDHALAVLDTADAVILPAHDGGYCLIGFRTAAYTRNAFTGIPWGSEHVCARTVQKLQEADVSYAVLPPQRDIDTHADVVELATRLQTTLRTCWRTRAFVLEHNMEKETISP